jgi:hypothetical protein
MEEEGAGRQPNGRTREDRITMTKRAPVLAGLVAAGLTWAVATARGNPMHDRLSTLKQQVEALRGGKHQWRHVPWRRCLVAACREAQEQRKPLLIWALGGDPTGRC